MALIHSWQMLLLLIAACVIAANYVYEGRKR